MEWRFSGWERWLLKVDRVLLWTGVVLLGVAAGLWLPRWRWSRSMRHASGTVTEMEARQDAQGDIDYFAHFRFRLPTEEIVQVVSADGSSDSAFSAGEVVPVAYKAGDAQDAVLAPAKQVYKRAIEFGVTGTILFDIGVVMWFRRRRREMRAAR